MTTYNEQQSRFRDAFRGYSSSCQIGCDCGRTHFVDHPNGGDFEPGELEKLRAAAEAEPDKHRVEAYYDYVETAVIDGREIVVDCPCGKYRKYCDWIEAHADQLAAYLSDYFKAKKAAAEREVENADKRVAGLTS